MAGLRLIGTVEIRSRFVSTVQGRLEAWNDLDSTVPAP